MRLPSGTRGLLAAAAVTGGAVCWRAASRRRRQSFEAAIDDAIAAGRRVAEDLDPGPQSSLAPAFGHH
ncbi:MAG: hypothetical protein ACYDAC_04240 [Candidatus Dormibacteria bacterium]